MGEQKIRELLVQEGFVSCAPGKREPLIRCRFCVHSVAFFIDGIWSPSPSRAYCSLSRHSEEIALNSAKKVRCDDCRAGGFRSIMNVIS